MDLERLERLLPAFLEIKDAQLRAVSQRAMLLAMSYGGWTEETIALCPVTLNWKGCDVSWIEHVTDVTHQCIAAYKTLKKYYDRHGVKVAYDLVVAGALIHDIGKLTEYVLRDGTVVHGAEYELIRHPLSGALIASEAGAPKRLVHLIATHSFEGDHSYQTPESALVRTIDIFVFNNSVVGLEKI